MDDNIVPLIRWGETPESISEALATLGTIVRNKDIDSAIIIAVDSDRNVISSGFGFDKSPFTLVGALETMKRSVMENIE